MQVMQCVLLAVTILLTIIQQSTALPLPSSHLSTANRTSTPPSLWKRGLFGRRRKSEEEIQEDARNKVLLTNGRGLKSKDIKKLSDEDFHKFMADHIERLDHNEANKLAQHLEKKVAKHSYTRATSLDAIHAQLKKKDKEYKSDYEKAHWAEDYAKTAELAKDKNPTVDHLHQLITKSQHEITKLHGVSKDLDGHVKKLWQDHIAQRQSEGKNVKKTVEKSLTDAHDTVKKIDMYPNVKKAYEVQEAKKAEAAAKAAKEAEEKAARKANRNAATTGWPLQGKIGSFLGYKSPSKGSSAGESNKSNASGDSQKDNGGSTSKSDKEGGSSRNSTRSGGRSSSSGRSSDEEDGSVSSSNASPATSPNSVIPGNSSTGPKGYYRKNSL